MLHLKNTSEIKKSLDSFVYDSLSQIKVTTILSLTRITKQGL